MATTIPLVVGSTPAPNLVIGMHSGLTPLIQTEKSFLNVYLCEEYAELIQRCIAEVDNELEANKPLRMYGKTVYQRRSIGFFSNESIGYYYSGQLEKAKPLKPNSNKLLQLLNERFGLKNNAFLVNKYIGGKNYISDHSDDEQNIGEGGVIAISHGAVRKFRIRDKVSKKIVLDIPTISNSIIHMGGDFQKKFTHGIPVEKKVEGIRYSFTCRKHTN